MRAKSTALILNKLNLSPIETHLFDFLICGHLLHLKHFKLCSRVLNLSSQNSRLQEQNCDVDNIPPPLKEMTVTPFDTVGTRLAGRLSLLFAMLHHRK